MNLKDRYAIAGVGHTKLGKVPNTSPFRFQAEAIKNAMEDAGLKKEDLDGLLTMSQYTQSMFMPCQTVAEYLGIKPKVMTTMGIGGATPAAMVQYAAMAIDAGMCNAVACVFGDNALTSFGKLPPQEAWNTLEYEAPYGMFTPGAMHAMAAKKHMLKYGTTSEQLGAIAVACRKHASMNPYAQKSEPITIEDHQKSKMFVEPLRLLDFCLVSDGGSAVVVTSVERAKDLKHIPVYIMGIGQGHRWPNPLVEEFLELGAKKSGEMAFSMAGISPKDIDAAQLYDCFTITVLLQLEDYGFCKRGEGGAFVENGRIELGGALPINTAGGNLSEAYQTGMLHIVEAVRQLRGDCGERQVKGAEIILVSGHGGNMSSHATLILRR